MKKNDVELINSEFAVIKYGLYRIKVTRDEMVAMVREMDEMAELENIVAQAELN